MDRSQNLSKFNSLQSKSKLLRTLTAAIITTALAFAFIINPNINPWLQKVQVAHALTSCSASAQTPGIKAGNGSLDDPFEIQTDDDLWCMSQLVNQGVPGYAGKHWKVTQNNISLSAASASGGSGGWTPIGTVKNPFVGYFKADSTMTFTDLTIDRENSALQGLFGVSNGSTFSNIALASPEVKAGEDSAAFVGREIGAGNYQDIYVQDAQISISGSMGGGGIMGEALNKSIKLNRVGVIGGTINASKYGVGGIVGYVEAGIQISNAFNSANIVAPQGSELGGIIGYAGQEPEVAKISGTSELHNVTNQGVITGNARSAGIVGRTTKLHTLKIDQALNSGDVTTNVDWGTGGIVGLAQAKLSLENVANQGQIQANADGRVVGGLVGQAEHTLLVDQSSNTGSISAGVDESGNSIVGGLVGYSQASEPGFVETKITNSFNTGKVSSSGNYVGGLIAVADKNITIEKSENSGTLAGKNMIGGMVGSYLNAPAEVSVKSSTNKGNIEGANEIGGLIGLTRSKNVIIDDSSNLGKISSSGNAVGGLGGSINRNSDSTHTISVNDSQNSGTINAEGVEVGGIFGVSCDSVSPSKSRAQTLSNVKNTGAIQGSGSVGGLIGYSCGANIVSSTNSALIHGLDSSNDNFGGIIGMALNDTTMSKVSSIGNIELQGNGSLHFRVGGILGSTSGSANIDTTLSFVDVAHDGTIEAASGAGGIVGANSAGVRINVTNATNAGLISVSTGTAGGMIGSTNAEVTLTNVSNSADISGNAAVGGIIGSTPSGPASLNDNKVIIEGAKNTGNISQKSAVAGKGLGGIIGNGGVRNHYVYNSKNYGKIVSDVHSSTLNIKGVGGIVGYKISGLFVAETVTNYGDVLYSGTRLGTGGILGIIEASLAASGTYIVMNKVLNSGDVTATNAEQVGGLVGTFVNNEKSTIIGNNLLNIGDINGGRGFVAGLFGYTQGTLSLTNAKNSGAIYGKGNYVAGLISRSDYPILTNVRNYGKITADGNVVGGIVAESYSSAKIDDAINHGDITVGLNGQTQAKTGGIVGQFLSADSSIESATNHGQITLSATSKATKGDSAGGIVGYVSNDRGAQGSLAISSAFNYGKVWSSKQGEGIGGIIGTTNVSVDLTDVFNYAEIQASSALRVAGIIGNVYNSNLKIERAANWGDVTGSMEIGGMVGYASNGENTINQAANYGKIKATSTAGGIVGSANNTALSHILNAGDIEASNDTAAGVVGLHGGGTGSMSNVVVTSQVITPGTGSNAAALANVNSSKAFTVSNVYRWKGTSQNADLFKVFEGNADTAITSTGNYQSWQGQTVGCSVFATLNFWEQKMQFGESTWNANQAEEGLVPFLNSDIEGYTLSKSFACSTTLLGNVSDIGTITGLDVPVQPVYGSTNTLVAVYPANIDSVKYRMTVAPGFYADSIVSINSNGQSVLVDQNRTGTFTYVHEDSPSVPLRDDSTLSVSYASGKPTPTVCSSDIQTDNIADHAGTEADPYLIMTNDDLKCMRQLVNFGAKGYQTGGNWKIGTDLDLSEMSRTDQGKTGWTAIGTEDSPFSGKVFADQTQSLTGLAVNSPNSDYNGLFGYTKDASFSNLDVSGTVDGRRYSALLVGYAEGDTTLSSITSRGEIQANVASNVGGIIGYNGANLVATDVVNYANIAEGYENVGGIFGYAGSFKGQNVVNHGRLDGYMRDNIGGLGGLVKGNADFADAKNFGTIEAQSHAFVGGLLGQTDGKLLVTNAHNFGTVIGSTNVGGLVGKAYSAQIYRSSNSADVSAEADRVGALIGSVARGNSLVIEDSLNSGNVQGTTYVGGLVGDSSAVTTTISSSVNSGNIYVAGAKGTTPTAGGFVGVINRSKTLSNLVNLAKVSHVSAVGMSVEDQSDVIEGLYHWNGVSSSSDQHKGYVGTSTDSSRTQGSFVAYDGKSTNCSDFSKVDFWTNLGFSNQNWDLSKVNQGYAPMLHGSTNSIAFDCMTNISSNYVEAGSVVSSTGTMYSTSDLKVMVHKYPATSSSVSYEGTVSSEFVMRKLKLTDGTTTKTVLENLKDSFSYELNTQDGLGSVMNDQQLLIEYKSNTAPALKKLGFVETASSNVMGVSYSLTHYVSGTVTITVESPDGSITSETLAADSGTIALLNKTPGTYKATLSGTVTNAQGYVTDLGDEDYIVTTVIPDVKVDTWEWVQNDKDNSLGLDFKAQVTGAVSQTFTMTLSGSRNASQTITDLAGTWSLPEKILGGTYTATLTGSAKASDELGGIIYQIPSQTITLLVPGASSIAWNSGDRNSLGVAYSFSDATSVTGELKASGFHNNQIAIDEMSGELDLGEKAPGVYYKAELKGLASRTGGTVPGTYYYDSTIDYEVPNNLDFYMNAKDGNVVFNWGNSNADVVALDIQVSGAVSTKTHVDEPTGRFTLKPLVPGDVFVAALNGTITRKSADGRELGTYTYYNQKTIFSVPKVTDFSFVQDDQNNYGVSWKIENANYADLTFTYGEHTWKSDSRTGTHMFGKKIPGKTHEVTLNGFAGFEETPVTLAPQTIELQVPSLNDFDFIQSNNQLSLGYQILGAETADVKLTVEFDGNAQTREYQDTTNRWNLGEVAPGLYVGRISGLAVSGSTGSNGNYRFDQEVSILIPEPEPVPTPVPPTPGPVPPSEEPTPVPPVEKPTPGHPVPEPTPTPTPTPVPPSQDPVLPTPVPTPAPPTSAPAQPVNPIVDHIPAAQGKELAFTDVNNVSAARRADIMWLSKTGVTVGSGCTNGGGSNCKYEPENAVTRGAMAQFLQKLAGWTDEQIAARYQGRQTKINDIGYLSAGSEANLARYYAIQWLSETGITTGCNSDGTKFCPKKPVNRGAMAEFMQKFAGVTPIPANSSTFPDVTLNGVNLQYGKNADTTKVAGLTANRIGAINWLKDQGITLGSGNSKGQVTYKPQDVVNRGAMAQFMRKLADVLGKSGVPIK
ncbi:MAG: hypothetical protein LBC43_04435 [Bifidobacteriaceae bacterium]|jgi:hypothetical protein|nr:hypothetical protein [Bifidobacteriaceae bacterium]